MTENGAGLLDACASCQDCGRWEHIWNTKNTIRRREPPRRRMSKPAYRRKGFLALPHFRRHPLQMLRGTFAFSILDWASSVLAAPHTARIARQISVLLFRIERLSCDRKQVVCQKLRWSRRTVHILRLMKRDSEARDVVNLLESTT